MNLFRYLGFLSVLFAAGCSNKPEVAVINHSNHELENVWISGSGFSNKLENVPVQSEIHTKFRCSGESGIRLTFQSNGTNHDTKEIGYVEDDSFYKVAIEVKPDFSAEFSYETNKAYSQ